MSSGSRRVILAALVGNSLIAVTKLMGESADQRGIDRIADAEARAPA